MIDKEGLDPGDNEPMIYKRPKRRAYHLRLGPVRIMRYPLLRLRSKWLPMRNTFGFQVDYRSTSVQVALYWWGFGKDGG